MPNPNSRPAHFEVDDPEAAFRKLEVFTRRLLAVPKKNGHGPTRKAKKKPKRP